jgi:hypothetical protein
MKSIGKSGGQNKTRDSPMIEKYGLVKKRIDERKKRYWVLLRLTCFTTAQIKGFIVDDKTNLFHVNILKWKIYNIGTTSEESGSFSLFMLLIK